MTFTFLPCRKRIFFCLVVLGSVGRLRRLVDLVPKVGLLLGCLL